MILIYLSCLPIFNPFWALALTEKNPVWLLALLNFVLLKANTFLFSYKSFSCSFELFQTKKGKLIFIGWMAYPSGFV